MDLGLTHIAELLQNSNHLVFLITDGLTHGQLAIKLAGQFMQSVNEYFRAVHQSLSTDI